MLTVLLAKEIHCWHKNVMLVMLFTVLDSQGLRLALIATISGI